jgi:hypothetical protein
MIRRAGQETMRGAVVLLLRASMLGMSAVHPRKFFATWSDARPVVPSGGKGPPFSRPWPDGVLAG